MLRTFLSLPPLRGAFRSRVADVARPALALFVAVFMGISGSMAHAQSADSSGIAAGVVPISGGIWDPSAAGTALGQSISTSINTYNSATNVSGSTTNVSNSAVSTASQAQSIASAVNNTSVTAGVVAVHQMNGFADTGSWGNLSGIPTCQTLVFQHSDGSYTWVNIIACSNR